MKHLLLLVSVLLPGLLLGEERIFTNTAGDEITASIVSATTSEVVLKVGVKSYTVPINTLSPDDQLYIDKFRKKEALNFVPNLNVDFQSSRSTTDRSFDDVTQLITPSATITNRERAFKLEGAKATVLTLAKDVDASNTYRVMSKDAFEFSIGPGESKSWEGKTYSLTYDQQSSIQYGHRYSGYIVVIQNVAGKIIHTSGTSQYAKYGEQALKLEVGKDVDNRLQLKYGG